MSLLAPDILAQGLFSLMRVSQDAREAYLEDRVRKTNLQMWLPAFESSAEGATGMKRDVAIWNFAERVARHRQLFADSSSPWCYVYKINPVTHVPYRRPCGLPIINEGQELQSSNLIAQLIAEQANAQDAGRAAAAALLVWDQKDWLATKPASPWARFARNMLDVSLDLVGANPQVLGGGRAAKQLFAALVPHLADAYSPDEDVASSEAERLVNVFGEAALGMLIEKPELISSEIRWQRLISGVLLPLQEEVKEDSTRALIAEGRMRELMTGSMSNIGLTLISKNADDYFKGAAANSRLGGIILRSTLGEMVSVDSSKFNLIEAFGQDGLDRLMSSTFRAAAERPDLFIRSGRSGEVDAEIVLGRKFLASFAEVLQAAPKPFRLMDGMAAEVVGSTMDIVADHLIERIRGDTGDAEQNQLGADLGVYLIRDIFDGLKAAAGTGGACVLDRFQRGKAIDLLKIIAMHIARSPAFLVGKAANPAIKDFASSLSQMIADDQTGLLAADDWRLILAGALDAAVENPATLFGAGGGNDIARVLVRRMLGHAADNFRKPVTEPGRVMFGQTLRDAIIVTLDAASSGILNTFESEEALGVHLAGVDKLVERLNGLAASKERSLVIGSREWVKIYAHYIAHVFEKGSDGVNALTDKQLLNVVRTLPTTVLEGESIG